MNTQQELQDAHTLIQEAQEAHETYQQDQQTQHEAQEQAKADDEATFESKFIAAQAEKNELLEEKEKWVARV